MFKYNGKIICTKLNNNLYDITDLLNFKVYNDINTDKIFRPIDESVFTTMNYIDYNAAITDENNSIIGNLDLSDKRWQLKLSMDNNIKYNIPSKIDKLYYDIECTSHRFNGKAYQECDFLFDSNDVLEYIVSISMYHNGTKIVLTLDRYRSRIDESKFSDIRFYHSSTDMALAFIEYLSKLRNTTLVLGYNSNIGNQQHNNYNIGYDLSRIIRAT